MTEAEKVAASLRLERFQKNQAYAADALLDRIQWCIWAEAKREDVVDVIDGINEATEFDNTAVAVVVVPRGISNQDAQDAVDAAFRAHLSREIPTMANEHFNRLTPAAAERLAMLAEEASEIVKAVSKILRHGYESHNPDAPRKASNRTQLEGEMADLLGVWTAMRDAGEVYDPSIYDTGKAWERKLRYAHHQDTPNAN